MKRITVAQIVSGLGFSGGVERVVYELASNLDSDCYRVVICCLSKYGRLGKKLEKQGIPVFVFKGKSSINPRYIFQNLRTVWQLKNLLRREEVQIVQTHEFFSGTIGRIAAKLAGTPITVLMLHNKDWWKKRIHILVDWILSKWTDIIITNSYSVKKFIINYHRINQEKITVIYNGIEAGKFIIPKDKIIEKRDELCLQPDIHTLCIVGSLALRKGHIFLIKALPAVVNQFPNLRLLIAGDDIPLEKSTKKDIFQLLNTLQLTENVDFLGLRTDIPEILSIIDIFILPSIIEGFGLAIAEAMAAGKPVVASNVDGIKEVVEDGVTGILVPPQNTEALANAILYLLNNPRKAVAMGKAGRKRVKQLFTVEKMVSRWDELYQHLAQEKGLQTRKCKTIVLE